MAVHCSTIIRHWLPIVTFCPVNGRPDLIYVSVEVDNFVELYQAREKIRREISWRKMYMEDVAEIVRQLFPDAMKITVRLAFDRHVVTIFPRAS